MDERMPTAPTRSRPGRHRRREQRRPHHLAHRYADDAEQRGVELVDAPAPKTSEGDGGASGRGPIGGDGGGRRPDRGGNDASRLLIVLGIIAVGAGVISARLLAKAGQRRA